MGTALQELRCESDLSQRASPADVSLLRLYLRRAYSLSGLWRSGTYEPRIRHGKIEDDIKQIFPEAKVARMDLDTTRTRTAYERIINDFEEGKTDILIGTQMISKGLDFDRVSVVGILNADSMMNYPDFRSYERAFQLMAQVAGRAGRKNKQGLVVLQTKSPENPLIHQIMANDYTRLYQEQMEERNLFKYPPFYRLIYVYLKHRKEDILSQAADLMAAHLRQGMGERILGRTNHPWHGYNRFSSGRLSSR